MLDLALQFRGTAGIERHAMGMLFEQALHLFEIVVKTGSPEWRREVIDDHGRRAALSLRAFTRIVDDERIKVRQWAKT